jgi:hypothetical protein
MTDVGTLHVIVLHALDLFVSILMIRDDGFQLKPKHVHNPYYITVRCGCG